MNKLHPILQHLRQATHEAVEASINETATRAKQTKFGIVKITRHKFRAGWDCYLNDSLVSFPFLNEKFWTFYPHHEPFAEEALPSPTPQDIKLEVYRLIEQYGALNVLQYTSEYLRENEGE